MRKRVNPNATRLIRLIRLFAASVGPLRHVRVMPGRDLVAPARQRAAERADLDRARLVLEVVAESVDELDGEVGVVDGRRCCARPLSRARPCAPRHAGRRRRGARAAWCDRCRRVVRRPWSTAAGSDTADRSCGHGDRASRSAPGGGTRRASGWRASPHGTGPRPGWRRGASCRTPTDTDPTDPTSPSTMPGTPLVAACGEPPARLDTAATRNNIEEPPGAHVNDRRRPPLAMAADRPGRTGSRRARARSAHRSGRRIIDERTAVGDHGVVHGVPVAAELDARPR